MIPACRLWEKVSAKGNRYLGGMSRVARTIMSLLVLMILPIKISVAYEFLEKRKCTLQFPTRPAVHTTCVISGGMSNGSIDVSAKTPDGKKYGLFGYLERTDGWILNKKAAVQTFRNPDELCIKARDGTLELCLNNAVED